MMNILFRMLNSYGVAADSRIDKLRFLFCKRAVQKRRYSAKETRNFIDPANRSHAIVCFSRLEKEYVHRKSYERGSEMSREKESLSLECCSLLQCLSQKKKRKSMFTIRKREREVSREYDEHTLSYAELLWGGFG